MSMSTHTANQDTELRIISRARAGLMMVGHAMLTFAVALENARQTQIAVNRGVPARKALKDIYGIGLGQR